MGISLKRLPWQRRLSTKISAVLTLVFALSIFGLSIVASIVVTRDAEIRSAADFQRAKAWTQKVLAVPIWDYDRDLVSELANSMIVSSPPFVREIEILDRDGVLIATANDGSSMESGDIVDTFPAVHQGEEIGRIKMRARPWGPLDYLKSLTTVIWASAFFTSLGVAFLSVAILDRLLTQPLVELIGSIEAVERSNYKISLKRPYSGELEQLADSYRAAISGIEARDLALSSHASSLERLVQDRTHERDIERMKAVNSARLASLGEISAGLAHEVNNPLAVIQGTVDLIEHQLGLAVGASQPHGASLGQAVDGHLSTISRMVSRIGSIVKGLKYLSRDGSADPDLEFSVNSMISEVQDLWAIQMKFKNIAFEVDTPPEDVRVRGQEVQLSQVVVNLVQNAADAVRSVENPSVRLVLRNLNGVCAISVYDNGPGVAEAHSEKIFQPFFTTKPVGQGTGLGLSIAQGIVQQHSGELRMQRLGDTTLFEVRITAVDLS